MLEKLKLQVKAIILAVILFYLYLYCFDYTINIVSMNKQAYPALALLVSFLLFFIFCFVMFFCLGCFSILLSEKPSGHINKFKEKHLKDYKIGVIEYFMIFVGIILPIFSLILLYFSVNEIAGFFTSARKEDLFIDVVTKLFIVLITYQLTIKKILFSAVKKSICFAFKNRKF